MYSSRIIGCGIKQRIDFSKSEEEEACFSYTPGSSPKNPDFGIERLGRGIGGWLSKKLRFDS
jgi:hypothetical protein